MERRENGKKEDKRERRGDAATPIWFPHLHVASSLSVLPATVRPFQPTFWARLKQAAEEAWVHYPLPIEKREKRSLSTIVLGRGGGFTLTITKATEKRKKLEKWLTAIFAFLGAVPRDHVLDFFAVTRLCPWLAHAALWFTLRILAHYNTKQNRNVTVAYQMADF